MRKLLLALSLAFAAGVPLGCAEAPAAETPAPAAKVGEPAPDFTLTDLDGKTVKLSELRGKTVVLEWYNPDCPFVVYAHGENGPLKTLPKKWTDQGVVWLAINSNTPGSQGSDPARNKESVGEYGMAYPVLLDPDGKVGRLYGSKNTPAMYVIDAQGALVYSGALDTAPLGKAETSPYTSYVDAVLTEVTAGRPSPHKQTKAYGCSVKYGS
jgi:peroxiredoxin